MWTRAPRTRGPLHLHQSDTLLHIINIVSMYNVDYLQQQITTNFLRFQCHLLNTQESNVPTSDMIWQKTTHRQKADEFENNCGTGCTDIRSHLIWARMSGVVIWCEHECPGWSFDVSTNVRPCQKSRGNECPWERMSGILHCHHYLL